MLAVAAVAFTVTFLRDMNRAYERVRAKGTVIQSRFGDLEYAEGGTGAAVLVVHGSGGGYDQGELIAGAVLDDGFRWIAPSRFGYLRSALREGVTWDDQADAYAALLDRLGIDNVAVVAMSQGGPSALLFAALHPDRVASLTLISCGVASSPAQEQAQANDKGDRLTTIFRYDFAYWAVTRLFRKQFLTLLGANDEVVAGLTDGQRQLFDRFIDYMNPASLRSAGVGFDNRAAMPGNRIAAITAPTLILHARDDTLQLFHNAEFAASAIAGSELVAFDKGGHFLIGVEQPAIGQAVRTHILQHQDGRVAVQRE